ncbi:unnamed protein product [Parnassius apollo]|uniref:(apollo) hypothetical protein n=1 Tax=Parnassius apollo TaxID=110799 RepID=A0A8S3XPK3_PARAO|nr:unnamed protein product [Parnassius apollo]
MASNRQVVSVDQPNAESILLDWLNDEDCTDDESQSLEPSRAVIPEELLSDSEDDCIPSDHDSDSECSVDSDDEDVLTSGLAEQLNDMNLKSRQYNERLPRQLRELISDITKVPLVEELQVLDDKLPRNQKKIVPYMS